LPRLFLFAVFRAVFFILGILIPIFFVFGLGSRTVRQQKYMFLGTVLGVLLLVYALPQGLYRLHGLLDGALMAPRTDLSFVSAEEYIPNPPGWLVYAVSFGLSALILGVIMILWRRLPRRTGPLELVAREAQKTLKRLRAGTNLHEGVMSCYFEMVQVLRERRGLQRHQAMTPREFERYLEEAGLPGVYIGRLTRLFEMVRYGSKNLGEPEKHEAIDCLTAIIRACEGAL